MEHASLSARRMCEYDLECVLAWRNHPDVRRFMLTQHEIELSEHRAWFDRVSKDEKYALLVIEENKQAVGCVIFTGAQTKATADWSFYTAPSSRPGTGKRICAAGLDFAFKELGVHKVAGQVLDFNIASIRVHQHLGFIQEGVLREHCFIDGASRDLICFGILSGEWAAR